MALPVTAAKDASTSPDTAPLFHRLNNQLGIILANAELLERKGADDMSRRRATQVVTSVLEAMATAKEIRSRIETREGS